MVKAKVVRTNNGKGFPVTGILVLLVGIVFLFEKLNIISETWSIIWPSIIIVIGISMLFKHYKH